MKKIIVLKAESIDDLVSFEEKEIFRAQRFIEKKIKQAEIQEKPKKIEKPKNLSNKKIYFKNKKSKEDSYKPLDHKYATYIPLSKRNKGYYNFRRRLKRGRIRGIRAISGYRKRKRLKNTNNFKTQYTGRMYSSIDGILQKNTGNLSISSYSENIRYNNKQAA